MDRNIIELPFNSCTDYELLYEFNMHNSHITNEINPTYSTNFKHYQELPFYNQSDFTIMNECITSKNKLLKNFENNNFSNDCVKLFEGLSEDIFSCKYYDENNFPQLLKDYETHDLKIFHLNIRSLNKHIFELKAYLSCLNTEFDIILLTETGKANINLINNEFPDYEMYIDPPTTNKGGAGILIKKSKFDSIEELAVDCQVKNSCGCSGCLIESKLIKVTVKSTSILIGSIYRHPNGNVSHFNDSLLNVINKLDKKDTFIIGGDMNIDLLKMQSNSTENYFNNLIENNFIPCISIPTRITESTITLIDHIFLRLPKSKINSKTTSGCLISDISDHLPNFLLLQLNTNSNKERPFIRSYSKRNIDIFNANISNELSQFALNANNSLNNIDNIYALFFEKISYLHNKYFPRVRLSRKKANDKVWITNGIKRSIKHKNNLFHLQLNNRTMTNISNWKTYRNMLNKIIHKAQIDYYKKQIDMQSNSCKGLWKTLGSMISNKAKKSQINKLKVNNKYVKNPGNIAEIFNKFFCEIGPNLSKKFQEIPQNAFTKYMGESANQSMFLHETNVTEVEKIISSFESKKSSGHDDIPVKFIKISASYISKFISEIINFSIKTGQYPDHLKVAKVIPIHKKGDTSNPNNYRPISILSVVNKIFEKILHKRLYSYLNKFNILYKFQFGFREGHSTTQALTEITDKIRNGMDHKNYTCGIFIDLCKAFDTVDHEILLSKMYHYGIRGIVQKLFKSYLTNRMQYVYINDHKSNLQTIKCGVPQGSVLGPLLFLLYINDIANCCSNGMFRVFADDTGIFIQGPEINTLIIKAKETMTNIDEWFSSNKLTLNIDKTCFIIFKHNRWLHQQIPDSISFSNKTINRVKSVKYLGLLIDESLKWNYHVNEVCNSIKKLFPIFYNIRQYINLKHARSIYYSMIYSKVKYAIIAYGQTSQENINKIQILQNKLMKVLTKKNYRFSTNCLHNELDIIKVNDIINQEIVTFVHGYVNHKLPSVFDNYFIHRHSIETYLNEDRKVRFITPRHHTNIGADAINVKGAQLWNGLTFNINPNVTTKTFRKAYRKSILPYDVNI